MFTLEVILLGTCLLSIRPTTSVDFYPGQSDCPDGFEYIEEVNVCLKPIFEGLGWDDAYHKCEKVAPGIAHLAVILSQEGNAAVVSFLQRKIKEKPEGVRCKADDDKTDGIHFWMAGMISDWGKCGSAPYVWKYISRDITMPFSSWNKGAPRCDGPYSGYCLYANSSIGFAWDSGDCRLKYCSLCEY